MKRLGRSLLCLLLIAALCPGPVGALAQNSGKIVRVGWFESPFNQTDALGRRSGYGYEYQQKISAFTGWTYEYVEASWPDLLQMLSDGRIDLLSDVSFTEERTSRMLFSTLPMGAEEYYLFVAVGNGEITLENHATLNGKRVGVNKDSIQLDFFRAWAQENGVEAEIVELTSSDDDQIEKLRRGDIDLLVSLDAYSQTGRMVPLCKIGSSDYYFAVSTARPELLTELNTAMARIREENEIYNHQLYTKYINTVGVNKFLSAEENAWLADHGTIRVGYQDNYLAFCAKDKKTGELTGALKDYLEVASSCLENAKIEFEAIAYPTAAAALEAMKKGEVDCAFPANLTDYDGEVQGYYITPALMRTDMSAIVRASAQKNFFKADRIAVAVNTGNTNYDMFLLDYFPTWRSVYFKDTPECLKAVADGKADCLLISNFRYNNIAELCQKYQLVVLSTGVEMDYCFAVNRGSIALYSILSKIAGIVPAATVNSSLSYYFTEDAKSGIGDVIRQNMGIVTAVLAAVALLVVFLIFRNIRSEKKAAAEEKLISATETDGLTGLYNKDYFFEYASRMYRKHPEKRMDAFVLNVEQFHAVNAINGRAFGDQALQALGSEIHDFLLENGGIGCHMESDQFAAYCSHMEDYRTLFDRLQGRLNTLPSSVSVQLRMGVMHWQADLEPQQMIAQAEAACRLGRGYFKERLVVFDEKAREREAFENRMADDLRMALESKAFVIHYQPIYDIRAEAPALIGAEALVRWKHPELGMIEPGDFIPLFEKNGQIGALDKYVWAEAAKQAARWRQKLGRAVPVSVNLARSDVFDPTLEKTLDALLLENGLAAGELRLEVSEEACADNTYRVMNVIDRLRKKGFAVALDDFGSGFSSLNTLSAMPVDTLKMDRAITGHLERGEKDVQFARLILGIAGNLNVPVVAEGVETEGQLRMLREMGCALAQGFYFSRPVPADEFDRLLERAR